MTHLVLSPETPRNQGAVGLSASFLEAHRRSCVMVLFVLSGASGLMLEIVWSRMLGWLLGATTWSVMAALVAFMGGLGIGGILWGRWASRSPRPLRTFGWLEIAVGLYTLMVPQIFEWLGTGFVMASRIVGESPESAIAIRVVTAVLALTPPTLLMGGTLPVLTRFAASGGFQPGRAAGALYAANTAGAVFGCFLTGCFLIFLLGVRATNVVAAVLDLGVGAAALAWDRLNQRSIGSGYVEEPVFDSTSASPALLIASVSGFCGLAYEVLWTRGLLAAITDDTTYAFTLMLSAFLAGHAMGAAAASWSARSLGTERVWRRLGRAQLLAALFALLSFPLLVAIRDPINQASFIEGMSFWGARIPFHMAISLAVFAPSAFFLGASFTFAARLYVGQGLSVSKSTGRLYGLNTLCAVLGAILATAWMIPTLGAQRSMIVLAGLQAAQGLMTLLLRGGRRDWRERAYATAACVVLVAMGCGLNLWLPLRSVYARQEPGRLLTLVEGAGAAVTVHQRGPTERVISINGVNVAGTNPVLRATQKLQAHLPLSFHEAPRSILQIGFGSGGTCYSVSLHKEVESIEVVELNPDVLRVADEWFRDVNRGVLHEPRVHVRIADAKSHVAASEVTYDVILSDSTHPRFRGNAALYARDYLAHCSRRLRPGGVVSTWLPLYGMSVDDVRGILKSFQSVFPHVQVWYANSEPHENTLVIASLRPLTITPEALGRRLAAPLVVADLAEVGITSTMQLLDSFMLGDLAVATFSRTGTLDTDNRPRLEFLAPRSLRRKQSWVENFAALRLAREPLDAYLGDVGSPEREKLSRWYAGTTFKLAGQSLELEGRAAEALDAYAKGVQLNPEDVIGQIRLQRLRRALDATRSNSHPPR